VQPLCQPAADSAGTVKDQSSLAIRAESGRFVKGEPPLHLGRVLTSSESALQVG